MTDRPTSENAQDDAYIKMTGAYLLSGVIYAAIGDPDVHRYAGKDEESYDEDRILGQSLFYETLVKLFGVDHVTIGIYLGERVYQALLEHRHHHEHLIQEIANEASELLTQIRPQAQQISWAVESFMEDLTSDDTEEGSFGRLSQMLEEELSHSRPDVPSAREESPVE